MKLKTAILLIIFFTKLNAQTTEVATGLALPYAIQLIGNDLYIAEFNANKISKIDITAASPTPVDVITGLNRPIGLALNGNDLYISEYNANKISKIDITSSTPVLTDVFTNFSQPRAIKFIGNILYVSGGSGFLKKDIAENTPYFSHVAYPSGRITAFAVKDNYLFFSTEANKVGKIDYINNPSTIIPVLDFISSPAGIAINGNQLFIAQINSNNNNKISQVDITAASPTASDFITGLVTPYALGFNGDELYFSEFNINNGKISKINLQTLATKNVEISEDEIELYPNPVSNVLNIETFQTVIALQLSDINGKTIYKTNQALQQIDMSTYTAGLYFLKIETVEGVSVQKVIKE